MDDPGIDALLSRIARSFAGTRAPAGFAERALARIRREEAGLEGAREPAPSWSPWLWRAPALGFSLAAALLAVSLARRGEEVSAEALLAAAGLESWLEPSGPSPEELMGISLEEP